MKKALLLGARGGIGSAIHAALESQYQMIDITHDDLDLGESSAEQYLHEELEHYDPDVIINAAGYLGTNQETHHQTMSVNFGSNWALVRYYQDRCATIGKPVKIVMIGSSAYRSGKKEYMLYSASKAAVYNLWESARDLFQDSMVSVDIINPVKTRTAMAPGRPQPGWLEPQDVAAAVLARLGTYTSECIDMKYKD